MGTAHTPLTGTQTESADKLTEQAAATSPVKTSLTDALSAALSSDYTDVISLNFATGEVTTLRHSNNALETPVGLHSLVGYQGALEQYADNNVAELDREHMKTALSVKSLRSRLSRSSVIVERYHVEREGFSYSYYTKIARVPDTPDFTDVVIAFAPMTNLTYESTKLTVHTGAGLHHRHSVLVVEDNELNQEILKSLLEDEYDIITANNGEEGLQVLAKNYRSIDCVLLDVNMPVCDGYEFLERARNDEALSQVPVIVTTANSSCKDELRCLELGAFDFVTKPYEVDVIKARLKGIIRLHESIDTLSAVEFDEMTGAYTRQAFFLYARELLNKNPDKKIGVIASKFANSSTINTIYGHSAGDKVLKYIGSSFMEVAINGIVCRYDSDRFISIFTLAGDEIFTKERFAQIAALVVEGAPVPNVEIEYGVYLGANPSDKIDDMLDRAFAALQAAEADSSKDIVYFAGETHRKMEQEQIIEACFDEALANDEFVPYFQPKCDTQTGELKSAEALVRWLMPVDDEGNRPRDLALATSTKMVSPGVFVPLFERDGLIAKLDQYMFRKVCRIQSERIAAGLPVVPVSINLSRTNLYRHDVVETYVSVAEQEGVPFDLVPIELTESVAVDDAQVSKAINDLADAGFPIQLDDFGSGYSSYASLARLPIDTLKIDKSLIDEYADRAGKIVISTSVTLAKALKMNVVAEGVETEDQVTFLKHTACDLIQGYYFSAPVPYERFSEMLAAGHA